MTCIIVTLFERQSENAFIHSGSNQILSPFGGVLTQCPDRHSRPTLIPNHNLNLNSNIFLTSMLATTLTLTPTSSRLYPRRNFKLNPGPRLAASTHPCQI